MIHLPVRTAVAIVAGLVLTFAAVTSASTATAESATIRITHTLEPSSITVAPGVPIAFENADGERHRMRTTSGPTEFDTGNLEPGERVTLTLSVSGTYRYLDERDDENPAYVGQIVVSTTAPTTNPGTPPTTSPPAPTTVSVSIGDRIFTPAVVAVAPGGTVTWTNVDDRPHTVTADDRSFDSGIMNTGDTWSLLFPDGGTFTYFCELHPDMRGTVTVDAGGGTQPPSPPPTSPPPTGAPPPPTNPPTSPQPTAPPVATTVPGAPTPSTATVAIAGNQFTPATVTVVEGGTVTWTNQDSVPHTVTATDRSFDSGILRQADTWSRTFAAAGMYAYFCELHPEMTGTVVVVPAGTPAPTPPLTPSTTATPSPTPTSNPVSPSIPIPIPTTAPTGSTSGTAAPASASVSIAGNSYVPQIVTIAAGGSVTWMNTDQVPHTVTADDRSFDSGIMFTGQSWTKTFTTVGTFSYFCELHPEMTSTVMVLAPGETAPSAGFDPGSVSGSGSATGSRSATGASAGQSNSTSAATTSGGDGATESTATAPGSASVTMGDNQFQPVSVTVGAGGTVTWTNTDSIPHTVTAEDGSFDSGIMMPGDTFSYSFEQSGAVPYRCTLHPGMNGTVEVDSAAAIRDAGQVASAAAPTAAEIDASGVATGLPAGGDEAVVIRIVESEFPPVVTIAAGQAITWVNDDDRPVDVVADDGSFASGEIGAGDRFTHTFRVEGAVSYRSTNREQMEGMVVVVAGSADEIEILPTVVVYDAWFTPRDLVVHQGDTVRWAFGGVLPHTATSQDGLFDSGVLEPGAVFTETFDELGTYPYSCLVHPAMIGTVTVVPTNEEIPASRSGISAIDGGGGEATGTTERAAPARGEKSDGAGAMVFLGLGLMIGLAVGVLYGVDKVLVRRPAIVN